MADTGMAADSLIIERSVTAFPFAHYAAISERRAGYVSIYASKTLPSILYKTKYSSFYLSPINLIIYVVIVCYSKS